MDKEKIYNLYDEILGVTLVNIYSLSKETEKIVFGNFNYKKTLHRVFLETAYIVNTLTKKEIGLEMPLIPFLYFKYIKMRKRKNVLVRIKPEDNISKINIEEVADFEASAHGVSLTIFNEIYNSYYKTIYERK